MRKASNIFKLSQIVLALVFLTMIGCVKKQKEVSDKIQETEVKAESPLFFKLSLAQWSLHKAIQQEGMSPLDFAQKASELGFEGIEYVSQLYDDEFKNADDPAAAMEMMLKTLKDKSETYGVKNVLIMVDGEGDLANLDEAARAQAVENHKKWVDAAKYLGCHSIRVNAHGEGTAEEVAAAAVKGLTALSEYADGQGINVLVENHGGYTSNGKWLSDVMTEVNMPNCGTLPDFGNFCMTVGYGSINSEECTDPYDIYQGVGELMPFAKAVSAKSYDFDENGNQPKIDYAKILQIVKDAGYTGFIGVEYEGSNLSEVEGIEATKKLLIKAAGQLK